MYSRYGLDKLSNFLLQILFIIFLSNILINNCYLYIVEIALLILIIMRTLSKNIYARNKENQKYISIKNKVLKPFQNIKRNIKDSGHIYKKCSKCKKTLKLPLPDKRGIQHVKCPNCKNRIKFITLKKYKIEIITNKNNKKK